MVTVICCQDASDQPDLMNDNSVKESDQPILSNNQSNHSNESQFAFKETKFNVSTSRSQRRPGVISKQKCDEYADYAWEVKYPDTLSLISIPTRTLECVFEKTPLVIGGTKAKPKEFPHMALLGYQPKKNGEIQWKCGGSLISENFVLTAAHCLKNRETGPVTVVRLGVTNMTDLTYAKDVEVLKLYQHPLYTHEKYHDIALLKINATSMQIHPALRPACLYTLQDIFYEKAIATGFGATNKDGDNSSHLLRVVLEFFNVDQCNKTYLPLIKTPGSTLRIGITDESMICAGSRTEFKDTCEGDSGGPIQVYHEETNTNKCMYDIVGVTSFGSGCGLSKSHPGVYTRVSYYIKWIEDIVWPEENQIQH